jgi:hypothetical protein
MLNSDLKAETWGRPIMAPWCGNDTIKYKVKGPGMIVVQNANTQRD